MDQRDLDFIAKNAESDPDLKAAWEDHILLKKQVEKLESKPFRSPSEEVQLKQLKKQKLEAKTRLADLRVMCRQQAEGQERTAAMLDRIVADFDAGAQAGEESVTVI